MDSQAEFDKKRNFLTRFAIWGTTTYALSILLLLLIFFDENFFVRLHALGLNEFGDLLAGLVGPVALIWLVFGYFLQGLAIRQQGVELSQNTEALRLQAVALNAQVVELANSVAQQRELVIAANAQLMSMRDAARPNLVVRNAHFNSVSGDIAIQNIGGDATNVSAFVSSGLGNLEDSKRIPVLPRGKWVQLRVVGFSITSEESPSDEKLDRFIKIEYEYGHGLIGKEKFECIGSLRIGSVDFVRTIVE